MIVTKKSIPRRSVLRGIGTTLALPLLDAMVPALTALGRTAATPVVRFGVVYVPNGIMMPDWTPSTLGTAFEFSRVLKPLEPFRRYLSVISGLRQGGAPSDRRHARACTKFLTNTPPFRTQGADVRAGISMDQLVAREFGRHTQLASLELALEATMSGSCEPNLACAYTDTISWRNDTTPLPMEHNPRAVFERLFGDWDSTDRRALLARIGENRSILDSISQKVAALGKTLGPADRIKLSEYLEAVRDIERRIQKVEEESARELPLVQKPAGIPAAFQDHAQLMFALQVLAYQSDLTRVTTFMVGREFSSHAYPEIGCPEAHHPTSHHQNDPDKLAKLSKINTYHVVQFAKYLEKLQSTSDGNGSLLDHSMILYGAGMSDGNAHAPENLPLLLVGGAGGRLKGGQHVRYPGTPMANLHLTLLDELDVHVQTFGDSTGRLSGLSA